MAENLLLAVRMPAMVDVVVSNFYYLAVRCQLYLPYGYEVAVDVEINGRNFIKKYKILHK